MLLIIFTLLIIAGFFWSEWLEYREMSPHYKIGKVIVCISMFIWGYWVMWWLVSNALYLAI